MNILKCIHINIRGSGYECDELLALLAKGNNSIAENNNNTNTIEDLESLVDDWESLEINIAPIPIKRLDTEEQDNQFRTEEFASERANRQRVEEHEAAWAAKHKREQVKLPKLERKTWKSINQYKGHVQAFGIITMLYQRGMTNRWTKKYKKNFPTWHAIGRKWQGQLDGFVNDFIKKLKQQKFKLSGKYDDDFWVDDILRVAANILPTVLKRHHKHVSVILESMIHDSARLDKDFKELHAGLKI